MPAMTLTSPTILWITLATLLAVSLVCEFARQDAILLVWAGALIVLYVGRDTYVGGLDALTVSRDAKLLILTALFTFASLHIHTFEVLWGLGKAVVDTAHLAGFRLGHAVKGLF